MKCTVLQSYLCLYYYLYIFIFYMIYHLLPFIVLGCKVKSDLMFFHHYYTWLVQLYLRNSYCMLNKIIILIKEMEIYNQWGRKSVGSDYGLFQGNYLGIYLWKLKKCMKTPVSSNRQDYNWVPLKPESRVILLPVYSVRNW
jgi:hypothetical protein